MTRNNIDKNKRKKEIGKIKWAFGNNTKTERQNNKGIIISAKNGTELLFLIDDVEQDSLLWEKYDLGGWESKVENKYVVYEEFKTRASWSGYGARHVQLLDEVPALVLKDSLIPEMFDNPEVRVCLEISHPALFLQDDIEDYFSVIRNDEVRELFYEKVRDGVFNTSVCGGLIRYFNSGRQISWPQSNWEFFDFTNENVNELQELYKVVKEKGFATDLLLQQVPQIWIGNKGIIADMPFSVIQSYYSVHTMNHKIFRLLMASRKSEKEKEWIVSKADYSWLLESEDLFGYLKEKDLISYIQAIDFLEDDKLYRQKVSNVLYHIDPLAVPDAADELISIVNVRADSSWNQYLPEWVLDPLKMPVDIFPEMESEEEPVIESESENDENNSQGFIDEPEFTEYWQQYSMDTILSVDQRRAVQSINGKYLLFAIPGSGKTTVIIHRLAYMIYGKKITEPILCMTFARDAATHMEEEYKKLTKDMRCEEITNVPKFNTIHGLCREIINVFFSEVNTNPNWERPVLVEDKDSTPRENRPRVILRDIVNKLLSEKKTNIANEGSESHSSNYKNTDEKDELVEKIANAYQYICCRCIYSDDEKIGLMKVETDGDTYDVKPFFDAYHSELKNRGLMDHTRCLVLAYTFISRYSVLLDKFRDKYKYICVDEAQDVSTIQYRIIKLLVGDKGNVFMVGDDDQSIYGFTGADPQEMLDFKINFPDGIKLEMGMNYRSCPEIVNAANRFISHNLKREIKPMRAHKTEGAKIRRLICDEMPLGLKNLAMMAKVFREMAIKEKSETDHKPTLAILYRKNISALPIMAAFLHFGVPFVVKASKLENAFNHFRKDSVSKTLIDLLRLSQDISNMGLLMRCFPGLGLYLSSSQVQRANEMHVQGESVFDSLRNAVQEADPEKIDGLDKREKALNEIRGDKPYTAICKMMNYFNYTESIRGTSQWFSVYTLLSMALYAENIQRLLDNIENLGNTHTEDESIVLTTMHSSKGQQYRAVIIVDAIDDFIPGNMSVDDDYSYDPEEERRIFYVALTRAEKALDILQYNKYYGHEYRVSDYVDEYVGGNEKVEDILIEDRRGIKGPQKLYYAVRDGDEPKIYFDKKKAKEKGSYETFYSLAEAEAYLYRYPEKLEFRSITNALREEVDLPEDVSKGILHLFNVDDFSDLSYGKRSAIREKTRYLYCHQKEKIDYSTRANEYAFMYLPVNFYKMWTPLRDAVRKRILPFESDSLDSIKVLELGPGPGTSTLSLLEFYYQLAEENKKEVYLEVTIVEYESAFIRVLKKMCSEYFGVDSVENKEMKKGYLHCRLHFKQCDAISFLHENARSNEYNLILESNMLNSFEHVESNILSQLSDDLRRCLCNFGVVLLVEPADKRIDMLKELTYKMEYTSRMKVIQTDQYGQTELKNIELFRQAVKYKLRPERMDSHKFRYAVYQKN